MQVLSVLCVLAVLVTGWATWRGGLAWARLRSRRQAALALVGAVLLAGLVGGTGTDQNQARSADVASADAGTSAAWSAEPTTPPPASAAIPSSTPVTIPEPVTTSPTPSSSAAAASTETVRAPAADTALAVLATLPVKGRAPKTGYSRAQFGPAWADTDRNGCDTRNDILRRDLDDTVIKAGTGGCKVLAGTAAPEVYTGATVRFEIGGASEIDIDHVVALSDAWQKGAAAWPASKRVALANDPLNLLAVDASANRQKGDGDAATRLPPRKDYRCAYAARQLAVKAKYRLWVTSAERDAITRVLGSCPGQRVPAGGNPTIAPIKVSVPTTNTTPRASTATTTAPAGTITYANCTEARAAGVTPLHRGDRGYSSKLDRDGDGVACE